MSKKRNIRNSGNKGLSSIDRMLKKKADEFIKAEREFWKIRYSIEDTHRENATNFELPIRETIEDGLSSIVWALSDGVVFTRYKIMDDKTSNVQFRTMNITLEEYANKFLIVPIKNGEFSLAQAGILKGMSNTRFINCKFNDIDIPYLEFNFVYYNTEDLPTPLENAIIDYQLTFLGLILSKAQKSDVQTNFKQNTIEKLKGLADSFELLLNDSEKEEELQIFLKTNPMLLHPTANIIPKKKLGEDFITDFVLVCNNAQGISYTLVEIEKASDKILTADNSLASKNSHAIKQTRDWDIWLEKNKAYLQGKLEKFETPNYIVVLGRSTDLDEENKAYLRSYNREWKNIELLTYDDLLVRFKNLISKIEEQQK